MQMASDPRTASALEFLSLHLCSQVSAGNQLFHVVVDNDDVATRITALLTEQKAGRVTFIPLNRINPQPVQYPDFGDDALPLVNKINCAEQHKKAVAQASLAALRWMRKSAQPAA